MSKLNIKNSLSYVILLLAVSSCAIPDLQQRDVNKATPSMFFNNNNDTTNTSNLNWKAFFDDPYLTTLIDSALVYNQELNIISQEILVSRNEVMARRGEYLPFVTLNGGLEGEKVGRYTTQGANDANTDIMPGRKFPEPLTDMFLSANASWELDVWRKLRNAKDAAAKRYLESVEGRNFVQTQLIAEIAESYYELLALDNQLDILKKNIEIQVNALEIVKLQKTAGKVTELAVKKFEAEVLKNRSLIFNIQQDIVVLENRINFLTGKYPKNVERDSQNFNEITPHKVLVGLPSQLLENRPDVRQAELEIAATDLDVKSAKANFYPAFRLTAGVGFDAFEPSIFLQSPESMIYSLAGELVTPLINKNAIKAQYLSANSRQIQAIYEFEKTLLSAYVEVSNQISNVSNLQSSFDLKQKQVDTLNEAIQISINLFKSARADYREVMLTQRDALEARFELVETKMKQMKSVVNLYRALGGGWK